MEQALQKKALVYDKSGEEHYNLISALHKSLRGSDPDAALYWLARMLAAGEDPFFIARRMVRFASEDIGNADPQALWRSPWTPWRPSASSGTPRASSRWPRPPSTWPPPPRATASTPPTAASRTPSTGAGSLPVPLHIRNAPTKLMKELGYGRGVPLCPRLPGRLCAAGLPSGRAAGRGVLPPDGPGLRTDRSRSGWNAGANCAPSPEAGRPPAPVIRG
ncbi:MAG: hypothetical protein MZV70_64340 [Desulfobacterales bacterium]|nr:hypothetical protein [Desulfobacterales bacterium]